MLASIISKLHSKNKFRENENLYETIFIHSYYNNNYYFSFYCIIIYPPPPLRSRVQVEGVPSTALREISVLKELKHPNVIRLHDVIPVDFKLFLVFEFLRQDLKDFLQTTPVPVPPALAKVKLENSVEHKAQC